MKNINSNNKEVFLNKNKKLYSKIYSQNKKQGYSYYNTDGAYEFLNLAESDENHEELNELDNEDMENINNLLENYKKDLSDIKIKENTYNIEHQMRDTKIEKTKFSNNVDSFIKSFFTNQDIINVLEKNERVKKVLILQAIYYFCIVYDIILSIEKLCSNNKLPKSNKFDMNFKKSDQGNSLSKEKIERNTSINSLNYPSFSKDCSIALNKKESLSKEHLSKLTYMNNYLETENDVNIGIIGCGDIGYNLLTNLINLKKKGFKINILVSTRRPESISEQLGELNSDVEIFLDNEKVFKTCDIIFLCVQYNHLDIISKEVFDSFKLRMSQYTNLINNVNTISKEKVLESNNKVKDNVVTSNLLSNSSQSQSVKGSPQLKESTFIKGNNSNLNKFPIFISFILGLTEEKLRIMFDEQKLIMYKTSFTEIVDEECCKFLVDYLQINYYNLAYEKISQPIENESGNIKLNTDIEENTNSKSSFKYNHEKEPNDNMVLAVNSFLNLFNLVESLYSDSVDLISNTFETRFQYLYINTKSYIDIMLNTFIKKKSKISKQNKEEKQSLISNTKIGYDSSLNHFKSNMFENEISGILNSCFNEYIEVTDNHQM
jgi:hypothetical protein